MIDAAVKIMPIAIQMYARQAQNVELERQACEIRLRAERRAGQLLAEMEKAKPGPAPKDRSQRASDPAPLSDMGISHDQSSRWQKLAKVPDDEFEEAVRAERPSTSGIIAASAPKPGPKKNAVNDHALWLWGRLNDIEHDGAIDMPDGPKRLRMVESTCVGERGQDGAASRVRAVCGHPACGEVAT